MQGEEAEQLGELMEEINKTEAFKEPVPFIVYDTTVARFERVIRRLIILIAALIVLFFSTNALWIYEWNQYDYADVTLDGNSGGNASYMGAGASGVINNNGEGKGQDQKAEE